MKQQTFIICFLASLAFGCEVSHPVDPEIVECKIAGGTWKNSKCLCPNEIATSQHQSVCKNDKLYTCSNGVYNLSVECPGTCHANGIFCDNTEVLNGDICQNGVLFSCSDGICKLKLVCPKGCDGENNSKSCALECGLGSDITDTQRCDGMYLKTCNSNGFWDMGRYCYNGCDKETNKCKLECNGDETKCEGNRLRKCVDGFWNDMYCKECASESECKKESCSYNALKCSKDSIVMQCDEYGEWQTKTQKICLSNILYSCDGKNEDELPDAKSCDCLDESTKCNPVPEDVCQNKTDICKDNILYICNNSPVTQISCPWGCNSDNKCNCDEDDNKTECNGNILSTCENGNVIETYCARGCDETGKSCKQASDNPEPSCQEGRKECTNNTLKICKNGQWKKLEDCGEKGCKDNNSCHSSTSNNYDVVCSDGEFTCIDMELKICEQGQWQLKEKCNDDSGTDMGFCYIDQCIKCEEIIGVECIGNMQSQIMCQTSEGRIPTQIDCAFGCTSNNDGYCEPCSESMPQKCESNKEYQCFNGMWQYTKTCALGCNDDNTACNEPTSPTQTCDPKVDKYEKCDMNNTAVVKCINGQWEPIENCGDNGCLNGACGECERGMSDICNGDTLERCVDGTATKVMKIQCAFGCSNGVCNSCDGKTKCEDSMEYKCDINGAWENQADATPCSNGCDKDGKTCAPSCINDESESKSYLEWYEIIKNDETNLSRLNSVVLDAYLYLCSNDDIQSADSWSVFEFKSESSSRFVVVSRGRDSNECQYDVPLSIDDKVEISERYNSFCEYFNYCEGVSDSNCNELLLGQLSKQYTTCETPSAPAKIRQCIDNGQSGEMPVDFDYPIIGKCNDGEWSQFEIKPQENNISWSCPIK